MSYLVLARKYRPRTFAEVAGQDVVTRTLRGAISEDRVGHAYLFFGPRGTGKTTSARLFAKALNCEQGPTDDPCGTCARCQAYDSGTEADLIEIDAASNTSVDHVRGLRDQASYVPLAARFKVFLIDEVHMLSKSAFNALLKTLEEPPPHVKFLFATTELHKVPDTVVSRCQVLRLSALSEAEIQTRLDEVFSAEEITAEDGVTAQIARLARGGMRDALSLADQLLALVGRSPRLADTERLAGEGTNEAVEAVLGAILAADPPGLLAALPVREGEEPALLDALLGYVRTALVLALVGEDAPMAAGAASAESRARMASIAKAFGAGRVELLLQELLHARERMGPVHMRAHARLVLETTLLDLCRPEATMPIDEMCRRLEALEARLGGAPAPAPSSSSAAPARPSPPRGPQAAPRAPQAQAPQAQAPAASASGAGAYVPPSQRAAKGQPSGSPSPPPSDAPSPGPARAEVRVQESAERRPPSARDRRAASSNTRVQTNSTADRWTGLLRELGRHSADLAGLLSKKGELVRESNQVAPLKVRGLTDPELAFVERPESRASIEAAFVAVSGEEVALKLEIHRGGASDDGFTQEITELFGGRVEN
ncbi:MAG: DNA polymerase III subunit gamma/tau [Planctomycetota bacterium]|nr:DNA polymerase III subunit gamma/tau [Planctomycetota bacterium]